MTITEATRLAGQAARRGRVVTIRHDLALLAATGDGRKNPGSLVAGPPGHPPRSLYGSDISKVDTKRDGVPGPTTGGDL